MKYIVLLVLLFQACGSAAAPQIPLARNYRSIKGDDLQQELALVTLYEFQDVMEVRPERIDLTFVTTPEEQIRACNGFAACTGSKVNGYGIWTYWPPEWIARHAEMLAHELCHVWYFQSGEHGDSEHTHTECFYEIAPAIGLKIREMYK